MAPRKLARVLLILLTVALVVFIAVNARALLRWINLETLELRAPDGTLIAEYEAPRWGALRGVPDGEYTEFHPDGKRKMQGYFRAVAEEECPPLRIRQGRGVKAPWSTPRSIAIEKARRPRGVFEGLWTHWDRDGAILMQVVWKGNVAEERRYAPPWRQD